MEEQILSQTYFKGNDYKRSLEYAEKAVSRDKENEEYRAWHRKIKKLSEDRESIERFRLLKDKDYYQVLGVPETFTKPELKQAYRKLAMTVHPDRNREEGATGAFSLLTKAHETLANDELRKEYDTRRRYRFTNSSASRSRQGGRGATVSAGEARTVYVGGTPFQFVFRTGTLNMEEELFQMFRARPPRRERREERDLAQNDFFVRVVVFVVFIVLCNILLG